ncbi:MAG: SurA N-terminal domain-containing protein [Deltaproteobacteria bacterium]|jgi:peptidyl-prolyl cis-trans isomerase D|nr:SurA N-terminal domain-containing protein [Deltaproteobacteria bacterium]
MLKYVRKNSGGIISIFIIGAIALVFIFWGIGGQDTGTVEDIRIDGQPVSQYTYSELLNNVNERLREQKQGAALTADEELGARRQALGYLIDRQNLLGLARGTGRETSVDRLNQEVKSNPMFQVDGRFSLTAYEDLVPRLFNRSLAAFEANLAEDLLIDDTTGFIKGLSFVPAEAVLDEYHFTADKLVLDYAYFPDAAFVPETVPDEAEIKAFYDANLELWRTPAQARLIYAEVDIADFTGGLEVTEEDLADAYFEEKDNLAKPEEAVASQILIRYPNLTPNDEEKAETLKRAGEAFERARTEDFSELAREISQDTMSASQGGALGTVRRDQNVPEVEAVIFGEGKDKIGEVVGPANSIFGYHILKVESYSPAHQPDVEEARAELTEIVTQKKARRLAVDKVEDLLEILPVGNLTAKLFADTAKSVGLEPKETELFGNLEDAPPFLAEDEDLVAAALATPLGQAGPPVENPERIILYAPVEKRESVIRPFEDETVRPEVVAAWQRDNSKKLALGAARAFIESAGSLDWEDMVEALPEGAESGTTEPFARMQFYSAGAYLTEAEPTSFLAEYFKLARKGDLAGNPIRIEGDENLGYLILAVGDIQVADETALTEAELKNLQATARGSVAGSAYEWWAYSRRAQARVQLPPGLQAMIEGQ